MEPKHIPGINKTLPGFLIKSVFVPITTKNSSAPVDGVGVASHRAFRRNVEQKELFRIFLHVQGRYHTLGHFFWQKTWWWMGTTLTVPNSTGEEWLAYTMGCITGPSSINLSWLSKKIGLKSSSVWDLVRTKYRPMYWAMSSPLSKCLRSEVASPTPPPGNWDSTKCKP